MTDELPEALRALIAAERVAPDGAEAAKVAVRARLGVTLKLGAAVSLKLIGLVVCVLAVAGAVVMSVSRDDEKPPAPAPVSASVSAPVSASVSAAAPAAAPAPAPAAAPAPAPAAVAAPVAAPAPVPVPAPAPAPVRVRIAPPPVRVIDDSRAPIAPVSASQAELLARASEAQARGDYELALTVIDEDARAHGSGALAEDREALRLQALLALHHTDDARAAARRFLSDFPRSAHRAVAQRALAGGTP